MTSANRFIDITAPYILSNKEAEKRSVKFIRQKNYWKPRESLLPL